MTADSVALARIDLPFGSGSVKTLSVVGGRQQRLISVHVSGGEVWPKGLLAVREPVTIIAVVDRPSWISWLTGSTQTVRYTMLTPGTRLRSHYLTVRTGHPLRLQFKTPVTVYETGTSHHLTRHILSAPQSTVTLPTSAPAGSVFVAAAPRVWEAPKPALVDWFPAGAKTTAVADPTPGDTITPNTPITISFSTPVSKALGNHLPPVSPAGAGRWLTVNSHTIRFEPSGYGYGIGARVTVGLPAGVNLLGGQNQGSDPTGTWTVPAGSTLRLQQMLAQLGYLPLTFSAAGTPVANTLAAQEAAAVAPPNGSFSWRYPNTPSSLRAMWQPGAAGVMTRGAVMAFESNAGMTADGIAGPAVWKALIRATIANQTNTFGYTFVHVSEAVPESIIVWHNGHTVVTGPVNTGVPAAPTALGVYPVYLRYVTTTMTGTNPDGSHYSDPGIPWVSYFNGGDALHGFIRASYGFPQSDGCVEMPFSEAHEVWPYTPIGTLVDVA